ncbi:MAG: bifunctional glutamate N-acetyltransferase/amino-acid acetyltransferase ArgJ [Actinomycetota bacterium]|nr:bifunctional glutamate N-acetyltransferase/amino-acid acetyltransferase ArgJ [Actinomycetota bacterium]
MSVTAPRGFVASGVSCGIKSDGALDLALVATEDRRPVTAAGTFTVNRAAAAPVRVSREHLQTSGGKAGAVLLNSGNANAATGTDGLDVARQSAALVAQQLGLHSSEVLVCSTGLIGFPLPQSALYPGIRPLVAALDSSRESALAAANAILTTDTVPREVVVDAGEWSVGAMAKGAAMLSPNMATMLAVLTTDASLVPGSLTRALRKAVARTFNCLSVDGCCSTNDTVIAMSSGLGPPISEEELTEALAEACDSLAAQMAADAEGAVRTVTIIVTGAADDSQALRAARKVADSQLVQCSLHGADPYWGRVVSELGSAAVEFELDRVEVAYGGVTVCRGGVAVEHDEASVAEHVSGREVRLEADLGLGNGRGTVRSTDLSPDYVMLNATTS